MFRHALGVFSISYALPRFTQIRMSLFFYQSLSEFSRFRNWLDIHVDNLKYFNSELKFERVNYREINLNLTQNMNNVVIESGNHSSSALQINNVIKKKVWDSKWRFLIGYDYKEAHNQYNAPGNTSWCSINAAYSWMRKGYSISAFVKKFVAGRQELQVGLSVLFNI